MLILSAPVPTYGGSVTVSQRCSSTMSPSTFTLTVDNRYVVVQHGYPAENRGPACEYTSSDLFHASAQADSNGIDSTSMIPEKLFSSKFVLPLNFHFISFASLEQASCTMKKDNTEHTVTLRRENSNNVYQGHCDRDDVINKHVWQRGTIVTCDKPVHIVYDQYETLDEHILYGYGEGMTDLGIITTVKGGSLSSLEYISNGVYTASFTPNGPGLKSIALYVSCSRDLHFPALTHHTRNHSTDTLASRSNTTGTGRPCLSGRI